MLRRFPNLLVLFVCVGLVQGQNLYPVKVGPDHRHLVDQNGGPFLVQGDAGWSLISGLTKEEAEKYLEARCRLHFNSIIVNLIEHKFRGPVNRYGEPPFTTPGDFSTPNEKYFEHADWVIRKAQEKGLQVFLAPIYLGYIGTEEGWIGNFSPMARRRPATGGDTSGSVIAGSTTSSGLSEATVIRTRHAKMSTPSRRGSRRRTTATC